MSARVKLLLGALTGALILLSCHPVHAGEFYIDIGIGLNDTPEDQSRAEYHYAGGQAVPYLTDAANPFGIVDAGYTVQKGVNVGVLHVSSIPDREYNGGLNVLYVKTRFVWHNGAFCIK